MKKQIVLTAILTASLAFTAHTENMSLLERLKREGETMQIEELTVKPYKDIRCKEYILDLRRWKDGKLATIDGWGRFSTFEITEKDKIKVTPLVKFPRKQIDGILETYPEADIMWASAFQAVQFISDVKNNRNVETVPIHSSYFHSHSPYLLDPKKKLFLIPYTGYDGLYTYLIYDFLNDKILYNPFDNENDISKNSIRFNFGNGLFLCNEREENSFYDEYCIFNYNTKEYIKNKLTVFLSSLKVNFEILATNSKNTLIIAGYKINLIITFKDDFSEITSKPIFLPIIHLNNKLVSIWRISQNNDWIIGNIYGYNGLNNEILFKYFFMCINSDSPYCSIPITTYDYYEKEADGQFIEHPVYGTCYIQKIENDDKDYIRLYKMSDVQKEIEKYLLEPAKSVLE